MQRLGQHFLKNKSALQKMARALKIEPTDVVIEIGPGHGELTQCILEQKPKKIIGIERDSKLVEGLSKKFTGAQVEIIEGDALKVLPQILKTYNLQHITYKLAGNVPYYITGHLLRILSESESRPMQAVLTIQREVAERIMARPPEMNRLSAITAGWAEAKVLAILPAHDFSPPPKVESAIIQLTTNNLRLTKAARENYYRMVKIIFQQPRKTVSNNLRAVLGQKGSQNFAARLLGLKINPGDRPQNLAASSIFALAREFF